MCTIVEIIQYLETLPETLRETATQVAEQFWTEKHCHRGQPGGAGLYGCRVRLVDNRYLNIVWFKLTRRYAKRSTIGFWASTKTLVKGRGSRYPETAFEGAHNWEAELISRTEAEFAKIRQHYKYVMKAIVLLKRAQKIPPVEFFANSPSYLQSLEPNKPMMSVAPCRRGSGAIDVDVAPAAGPASARD